MDTDNARINMFKQQLRTWGVLDEKVIELFANLPREQFLPASLQAQAYADCMIQTDNFCMLPPKEQGRLLQACKIQPTDNILELGTGTGFMTALLARSGLDVHSVDNNSVLTQQADQVLSSLHIGNVHLSTGDMLKGLAESGPFDVIMINGSLPFLPNDLRDQLAPGGRLCAIIGKSPTMQAMLLTKNADNSWQEQRLFETDRPRLAGVKEPEEFSF